MSMTFLAIDYGKKRIGLAKGQIYPQGLGIIDGSKSDFEILAEIDQIAKENDVLGIVIGLPIRSQGEEGTIAPEIRQFAARLSKKTGLKIYFEPEQFTSSEAERIYRDKEIKYTRQEGSIDELSAVLLLEQFLNRGNIEEIKPDL